MVFVYAEKENYKLVKGVAKTNKNYEDVSGDVFSYMSMENGMDILALSDGMGSGENAFLESKTAIEILEHLLEGGFDISVAIKTVNAILSIKNDNQMFATLDISTVNRFTGECEFIKNGAVSTLLKRQGKVEVIKNDTLPLGMFKDVECKRVKKKLRADDIVVMISDGIVDACDDITRQEEWIEEALIGCKSLNPQFIADSLLDLAKSRSNGQALDDMTVLVFRVWERN
jgi:stage II sporulation protein E